MISTEKRQATISTARRHSTDSGSPEVQVSLLTERISSLSEHLQSHRKDVHSKRGLVQMVNKRNKLLKYLARTERDRYTDLIARLGLRK